ncbi:MAG TPA: 50S ribosomal protein L29 [Planctomycetes bacterium]|jgi:large subunit ribosomal protein L29|nr:50S ribosomal protein L29 [Planctomycetota bacterium]
MKIEEVRSKTDSELKFDLGNLKKELFELKFRAATDSGASTAKIRENRRSIARINTILHERVSGVRGQEPR